MADVMADSQARPLTRILVANRGEIARRVFRSAHAMGITTVAVYADGDRHAPFVNEADFAVPLAGTTAAQTYLDASKVLAAAAASGADAVHPGYGFLSENAAFAQAVIDAGLTWIGPSPDVIAAMGDKLAAKETMIAAGVPTLPSLRVDGEAPSEAELAAAGLGSGSSGASAGGGADGTSESSADGEASAYPLMVKASAGGGGKGMRIVANPADLTDAIAAARREAAGAFGDDTVFVERCLTGPRHVEIQVLGDSHGNLVHLFERECSVQRRHQKVIEEAPSSVVTPALRERLGTAALTAVGTLGYTSAGTVEFLLTGEGDDAEFFFLEINTRLQVEHPVTEAITGLDLVREQIRIAAGEPLGYEQADLAITGWAIEARLYAEDPQSGFLPSTGTLDVWSPPGAGPAVGSGGTGSGGASPATGENGYARFDSGVEQDSVIGTEFDPMLAKVIKHAPTRAEASLGLALALERTRIGGVVTNRDFLVAALRSEEFLAGRTDTDFIERTGLAGSSEAAPLAAAAAAIVLVSAARNRRDANQLAFMPTGYRNSAMPDQVLPLKFGDLELSVHYKHHRDQSWSLSLVDETLAGDEASAAGDGAASGTAFQARIIRLELCSRPAQSSQALSNSTHGNPTRASQIDAGHTRADIDAVLEAEIAGLRGTWNVSAVGGNWYVDGPAIAAAAAAPGATAVTTTAAQARHSSVTLTQRSRFPELDAGSVEGGLTAPMPGKIIMVDVTNGDSVTTGQVLVVMEAMKMEHQIAAPADGTITEVRAAVGDQVDNGELLVVISAEAQ